MTSTRSRGATWHPFPLLCGVVTLLAVVAPEAPGHPAVAAVVFALSVLTAVDTAWRAASHLLPQASTSLFLTGTALCFEAIAAGTVALLGSVHAFRLPLVMGLLAVLHGSALRFLAPPRSLRHVLGELPFGRGSSPLVAAAFLAVLVMLGLVARNQVLYTTQDADSMWYHLVMVGEWVRSGSIAPIEAIPVVGIAYPGFRQAILAFLSLPFGSEHLALLGILEFPLLTLSVYTLARAWGANIANALAGGLCAASTPIVLGALSTQGNDLTMAIHLLLSLLFLGRFLAGGAAADGVLAGLALGALAATKFSGPGYAGIVVVIAVLQHGVSHLRSRGTLLLVAGALLQAAPWYVRNLLAFGNPLYPARMQFGEHVVCDGPLGREYFAKSTLGFDVAPLVEHAHRFVDAHGWIVVLVALGPLLVAFRAERQQRPVREGLGMVLLPVLLFVAFLHHPFNHPLHDAECSQRYLSVWFGASMVVTVVGLSGLGLSGPWVLLCLGSAFLGVRGATHWAVPMAALVAIATACLWLLPVRTRVVALCAWISSRRIPVVVVLAVAAVSAFGVERFAGRQQYDPATGYHDAVSERGWGPVAAWVHQNADGKRIGLHGSIYIYPLLGEPFSNRIFLADDLYMPARKTPVQLAAWARDQRLDYLVCCVPRLDRPGTREFVFGEAITQELLAQFPQQFTVAATSRGASVLRVHAGEGR